MRDRTILSMGSIVGMAAAGVSIRPDPPDDSSSPFVCPGSFGGGDEVAAAKGGVAADCWKTTWGLLPDESSPSDIDKSSAGRTTYHQPASTWHCTGRLARLFTANTNTKRADDSLLTTNNRQM